MQSELLRQQRHCSQQRAQRYEISLKLADIEQQLAIQLYQAKQRQHQQKIAHERSTAEVSTLQADYDTLKAKQDKLTARINQEQWLKDDAQSAHYDSSWLRTAEHQLSDATAQLAAIEQQLSHLAQQREQSLADIERLNAEQAEQQQALETLRPQLAELSDKRDNHKRHEQPLQRAWRVAKTGYHACKTRLARLSSGRRLILKHKSAISKAMIRATPRAKLAKPLAAITAVIAPSASAVSASADASQAADEQDLHRVLEEQVAKLTKQLRQIERQQEGVDERLLRYSRKRIIAATEHAATRAER